MMGDDERMTDEDDTAPGWDAIDSALSAVYGDAEPARHWGTLLKWRLGGPDPLDGISVYERSDPVPHWHYVSYGLTELYAKENKDLHVSGWGFELTARLRRADETEPPIFMANVLQNVARYVFETGNVFAAGHSLDLFGPIEEGSDTLIQGAIFYDDPELAAVDGPFGQVRFLQIVGVTLDERAAIRSWNADAAKPILSGHLPLLVTDLNRRSLLNDPEVDRAIVEGRNRDGSSLGALFINTLAVQPSRRLPRRPAAITLPATVIDSLCLVLPLRIPFGRPFQLTAAEASLTVVAGSTQAFEQTESDWTLTVTGEQAASIGGTLRPVAGRYDVPGLPDIVFQVERTPIRDQQGNITSYVG